MKPGQDGISVDDLSDQFRKHKGLLENLTLSIGQVQSNLVGSKDKIHIRREVARTT